MKNPTNPKNAKNTTNAINAINTKVFVAGGTGMVGSAIIRKLLQKGYKNIVSNYHKREPFIKDERVKYIKLDLRDQKQTEEFFEKEKPDWVFLSAAKVGGILANNTYKAEFIYDNIMIASNIIHSSYKYGVKKLLNLGSSCIYPRNCPQPMKEEYLLTGSLEPTNEPYAIAKISAIKLCRYYNEQYGTNFISVMPTNLYGPYDNFNLETSHVLPALIRKFHLAKLLEQGDMEAIKKDLKRYPIGFGLDEKINFSDNSSILQALAHIGITPSPTPSLSPSPVTVTVWGTGEVYREFLHVDDLADACLFLMENIDAKDLLSPSPTPSPSTSPSPDYFVNIGTGEDIKLKDLIKLIKDIVGFKGQIKHDLSKPDGMPRKLLDVSKINRLGWRRKIDLKEGIIKTYKWYLQSVNQG